MSDSPTRKSAQEWARAIAGDARGHTVTVLAEFFRAYAAQELQVALGALADIALSDDMTEAQRRAKAQRIYDELSEGSPAPGMTWETFIEGNAPR